MNSADGSQLLADQVIVDIINHNMDMPAGHVWLRNQNRNIPTDPGMFVVVGMISSVPFTIKREVEQLDAGMIEVTMIHSRDDIQIDVFSRDTSALLRRYEVLAALQSIYSQQAQEVNRFKIFKMPTQFSNTSDAEGGSQLNRYTLTIPCHVWYRKEKLLDPVGDYYDKFRHRIDDKRTIGQSKGMIEFTIDKDTV